MRLPPKDLLGQAEFGTQRTDLVLEEFAEGFEELEVHLLRKATDIVVALDNSGGISGYIHALDHVGVKRSLA